MDLQLSTAGRSLEESVSGEGWMTIDRSPDGHKTSGLSGQASAGSGLSKTQRRKARKRARLLSASNRDHSAFLVPDDAEVPDLSYQLSSCSIGSPSGGTPLPLVLFGLGSASSGPVRPPEKRQKQLAFPADHTPTD
jgi:hypothetical protein